MKAQEKARDLLARYGGTVPVDVDSIVQALGLEVVERPFSSVEEVWLWPCIGIRKGLSRPWRRWMIAHALGHYLLHRGNQLRFHKQDGMRPRQEMQAEQFAAWLLMPDEEVARMRSLDLWEFAEYFDVPLQCVAHRFAK